MRAFDLGLAGYVLNSSVIEYSYDALLDAYCGGVLPETKTDEPTAPACTAAAARHARGPLTQALGARRQRRAPTSTSTCRSWAVLAIMERTGAAIDVRPPGRARQPARRTNSTSFRARIFDMAGEDVQPRLARSSSRTSCSRCWGSRRSKKNAARLLHRRRGAQGAVPRCTSCPRSCCATASLPKIKSTYIDALPRMRAGDGRVHTCVQRDGHHHGALVVVRPEPAEHPRAHRVRPPDPRVLRAARIRRASSCRPTTRRSSCACSRTCRATSTSWRRSARARTSTPRTAARVFDVPVEEVTPELRSRAKAVNFGIVYGQQAFGLSQSLGHPVRRGEGDDRALLRGVSRRARLPGRHDRGGERRTGYAETMFGRKRHIPELKAANASHARLRRAHGHEPSHAGLAPPTSSSWR